MSPRVAILMGSDSDLPVMAEAARMLKRLEVPFDLEVTSAHRTPERTVRYVTEAPGRGISVFIVGAGGAAHLAGVVAAHTVLPVLGVPLAATDLQGVDALYATVMMPAGVPVGTLAIGKAGAANAALLAAEILGVEDAELRGRLEALRRENAEKVARRSDKARADLPGLLGES
jgi:5-(carboxyamino)imidazole ribonucleotide mutase